MSEINIILAMTPDGLIGDKLNRNNNRYLPWSKKETIKDMEWFKQQTLSDSSTVIMGKNTFIHSLNGTPLSERCNLIVSRSIDNNLTRSINDYSNVKRLPSIEEAIHYSREILESRKIFIIGGKSIFEYTLTNLIEWIDNIYLTIVNPRLTIKSINNNNKSELVYLDKDIIKIMSEKFNKLRETHFYLDDGLMMCILTK